MKIPEVVLEDFERVYAEMEDGGDTSAWKSLPEGYWSAFWVWRNAKAKDERDMARAYRLYVERTAKVNFKRTMKGGLGR